MFKFTIVPKKGYKVSKKELKILQDFVNTHEEEIEQDYIEALIEFIYYGSGQKKSLINKVDCLYMKIFRNEEKRKKK